MPISATLTTVVIDCAAPGADCVCLGDGGLQFAFTRVLDYQPPTWPSSAKQAHLDFMVADMDQAVT